MSVVSSPSSPSLLLSLCLSLLLSALFFFLFLFASPLLSLSETTINGVDESSAS